MKKKTEKIILILLSANLLFSCLLGIAFYKLCYTPQHNVKNQYVMYVGTNDKDTYQQIISTEDAKSIIDKICYKYLDGYTIQDAVGSWSDEKGFSTHENTILCIFDDVPKEKIYVIADEILKELNQNTILIEEKSVCIEFYGGK